MYFNVNLGETLKGNANLTKQLYNQSKARQYPHSRLLSTGRVSIVALVGDQDDSAVPRGLGCETQETTCLEYKGTSLGESTMEKGFEV